MRQIFSLLTLLLLCGVSNIYCDPPAKASGCKPLHGVTYDPFALSAENICLSEEQVVIDVQIMASFTQSIRIYSLAVCPHTTMALLAEAQNQNLSILLGVFIGRSVEDNENELAMMEKAMEEYSGVIQAIVVGNDALINGKIGSNHRLAGVLSNIDILVDYIKKVKKILNRNGWNHRVSTSEGWGVWESEYGATLAEAIDFICLKINPYHEGIGVDCSTDSRSNCISASDYVHAKAKGLSIFYTKDVWICETGWPTAGTPCCAGIPDKKNEFQAVASSDAATTYLTELVEDVRGRPYFISSAFDRDWRRIWSPCSNCAEMNLALSSFEDGICDLCEEEYQLGIFDHNRERKEEYKIPEVNCSLPELPETRLMVPDERAEPEIEFPPTEEEPEAPSPRSSRKKKKEKKKKKSKEETS